MKFLSIILITCLIVALSEAAPKKSDRNEKPGRGPPKGKGRPQKTTKEAAEVNALDIMPEGADKAGLPSAVHKEESRLDDLRPAVIMDTMKKSPQDNPPKSMPMQVKTKETMAMERGERENSTKHMDCDRVKYVCSVDKDFSLKNQVEEGKDLVGQFDSCSKWAKEEKPAEAPEGKKNLVMMVGEMCVMKMIHGKKQGHHERSKPAGEEESEEEIIDNEDEEAEIMSSQEIDEMSGETEGSEEEELEKETAEGISEITNVVKANPVLKRKVGEQLKKEIKMKAMEKRKEMKAETANEMEANPEPKGTGKGPQKAGLKKKGIEGKSTENEEEDLAPEPKGRGKGEKKADMKKKGGAKKMGGGKKPEERSEGSDSEPKGKGRKGDKKGGERKTKGDKKEKKGKKGDKRA